jgi:hypothetical protein
MLTPFVLIVMLVPAEAASMKPRSLGIIETRGLNAVGLHSEATCPRDGGYSCEEEDEAGAGHSYVPSA